MSTNTPHVIALSGWHVAPADNNHTRVVVAAALIQTLDSLHLKYPEVGPDKLKELATARAALVK